MLSRFSSLFTYVVVGLVVSAAATPLGPLDGITGDKTKSLTHPNSSPAMKPYDNKPSGDRDNERNNKPKPYDGDDMHKSYDDDDKPYDDGKAGQCSVRNQHCCNQVNEAHESAKLDSLGLFGLGFLVNVIKDSNKLWGSDCSPFMGANAACDNQPICCENNHMNGLIVVGCSNVNII